MGEGGAEMARGGAKLPDLEGFERYAVYYAPRPDEPLSRFGEGWLGRAEDGSERPRVAFGALGADQEALTREPRRYGLHGTLKAPFVLKPGAPAGALDAALSAFAASRPAASWSGWRITGDHGFTALRPKGPSASLDGLAAGVAARFAAFGAPPSAQILAKRRAAGLSPRQEAYLAAYGYPYVFEEFSFHVTLTGRAAEPEAASIRAALQEPLAETLADKTVWIRDLCLFGDPGDGAPFRLLRRHPLAAIR